MRFTTETPSHMLTYLSRMGPNQNFSFVNCEKSTRISGNDGEKRGQSKWMTRQKKIDGQRILPHSENGGYRLDLRANILLNYLTTGFQICPYRLGGTTTASAQNSVEVIVNVPWLKRCACVLIADLISLRRVFRAVKQKYLPKYASHNTLSCWIARNCSAALRSRSCDNVLAAMTKH